MEISTESPVDLGNEEEKGTPRIQAQMTKHFTKLLNRKRNGRAGLGEKFYVCQGPSRTLVEISIKDLNLGERSVMEIQIWMTST